MDSGILKSAEASDFSVLDVIPKKYRDRVFRGLTERLDVDWTDASFRSLDCLCRAPLADRDNVDRVVLKPANVRQ